MSDHAWWTPARRKLYGRPTVNGMTCQICGRRCQEAERERDAGVALLRDVAQSGVAWKTRDYVVAQIDRATWDAVRRIGGRQ